MTDTLHIDSDDTTSLTVIVPVASGIVAAIAAEKIGFKKTWHELAFASGAGLCTFFGAKYLSSRSKSGNIRR